jgi:hypothetical protein
MVGIILPARAKHASPVSVDLQVWISYQLIIVYAHHFGSLYDEVINTAQSVLELASVVQQQNWINSMQNADCFDYRLHSHCEPL